MRAGSHRAGRPARARATKFEATIHDHRYAPRVEADLQAGQQRGIRGSPVLLVNGKRIDGVPSEKMLAELVDAALAAKPVSERAEGGRQ